MSQLLSVEHVGYRYPGQDEDALGDVSLTLWRGQVLGLLGPNGSGKSTLINLLAGVRSADRGQVRRLGDASPTLAWVPQEYAFYPALSCAENLHFFASMLSLPRPETARRIDVAIAACQLGAFTDKAAQHCSGGVRRRLNIAIALLHQPDVLLLDEPTAGVDPQSRAFLLDQVRDLAQQGTAIVYATHYMEEVTAVCNRILLLDRGQVLTQGDLQHCLEGSPGQAAFANLEALFMHYTHSSLRD